MSAPVITAKTPGSALAADVSIDRMRACGRVPRSSLQKPMRGSFRSSA